MRPGLIPFICLVGILVGSCTPASQQHALLADATPETTTAPAPPTHGLTPPATQTQAPTSEPKHTLPTCKLGDTLDRVAALMIDQAATALVVLDENADTRSWISEARPTDAFLGSAHFA